MSAYPQLLDEMMDAILARSLSPAPKLYRDKKDFPPNAQLEVYVEGYRLRLIEVVEATYPALQHYLGKDKFRKHAAAFVEASPSRHFNLDHYPAAFSDYLTHEKADDFARELALLENAIHAVYQGEETPALTSAQAATLTPQALSAASLKPRAASRLLAFTYPVNEYVTAFRENGEAEKPAPQPNWLIVLRHRHQVNRLALAQAEYTLLSLLQAGRTLEQALEDEQFLPFADSESLPADLQQWFGRWIQEGVLREI